MRDVNVNEDVKVQLVPDRKPSIAMIIEILVRFRSVFFHPFISEGIAPVVQIGLEIVKSGHDRHGFIRMLRQNEGANETMLPGFRLVKVDPQAAITDPISNHVLLLFTTGRAIPFLAGCWKVIRRISDVVSEESYWLGTFREIGLKISLLNCSSTIK